MNGVPFAKRSPPDSESSVSLGPAISRVLRGQGFHASPEPKESRTFGPLSRQARACHAPTDIRRRNFEDAGPFLTVNVPGSLQASPRLGGEHFNVGFPKQTMIAWHFVHVYATAHDTVPTQRGIIG